MPFYVDLPVNEIISENSFIIYRAVNYKGKKKIKLIRKTKVLVLRKSTSEDIFSSNNFVKF